MKNKKEEIKLSEENLNQKMIAKKIRKKINIKRNIGVAVSILMLLAKELDDWKNQIEPPVKYPPIIQVEPPISNNTQFNTAYDYLIAKLNKDSSQFNFKIDSSYKLKLALVDDLGDNKKLNLVFQSRNKSVSYIYDITQSDEYNLTTSINTAIEQLTELQLVLQHSGLINEPQIHVIDNELNEIFDNQYNLIAISNVSTTTKLNDIGRKHNYFNIFGTKTENGATLNVSILVSMSEYNMNLNDIKDIKHYFMDNPDSDLFEITPTLTYQSKMEQAINNPTVKKQNNKIQSFDDNYFTF